MSDDTTTNDDEFTEERREKSKSIKEKEQDDKWLTVIGNLSNNATALASQSSDPIWVSNS